MTPPEESRLLVASRSHPGMSGKNNEDRLAVTAFQSSSDSTIISVLAVVSDGIGGHHGGEIAAEKAVTTITKKITAGGDSRPAAALQQAVTAASREIAAAAAADPELRGMGATCACAWVIGNYLYTASVGDSRIYLLRNGTLRQLTFDHTWIQDAIQHGLLTPEQARGHVHRHVISRYLGSTPPPAVDLRMRLQDGEGDRKARQNQGTLLQPGDRLLLCSDGLTDLVADGELARILPRGDLESRADALIALANKRGGHDNISVILLEVPGGPDGGSGRRMIHPVWFLGIVLMLVLIGLAVFTFWWHLRGEKLHEVLPEESAACCLWVGGCCRNARPSEWIPDPAECIHTTEGNQQASAAY